MALDATFWVGIAFVVFIGIMAYYKVHRMIFGVLDERARKIRHELEESQRLREEAQALLAQYERKQRDAMQEAEEMFAHAGIEARRETEIAQAKLEELIRRREQMALEKIALAEAQAQQEVRDAAIEAAISAAEQVISGRLEGERAKGLIEDAIRDLRRHLN